MQARADDHEPEEAGPVVVAVLGAGEAVRRRIGAMTGFALVDLDDAVDPDGGGAEGRAAPDVVLVSTRLPRTEAVALVGTHREAHLVIALVHTGGEALAADLLRAGAGGLLAEGNEGNVQAFLTSDDQDTGLLEVYDRQIGRSQVLASAQHSEDPVTGLPNASVFDGRVLEAQLAGEVPRIGHARLLFLQHQDSRGSAATIALIRRRLALQLLTVVRSHGGELFALSDTDFTFLGADLPPQRTEELAEAMSGVVSGFAPWGHPLALAVGHAGPEVSEDVVTVRQLAERAVEVAALEQRSTVVGAATLALGASSTTELEAALRLVDVVERHDPHGPGQAARVADLAAALAWELGYEGRARAAIRLAAHLHDIGKVSLPTEAMFPGEGVDPVLVEAARAHPARAAGYLRPLAGAEIAAAVRSHHERWDGTGFPDGLAGAAIPVGARIIAVAAACVRAAHEDGCAEGLAAVVAGSGTAYDPSVVEAATALLQAGAGGPASPRSGAGSATPGPGAREVGGQALTASAR